MHDPRKLLLAIALIWAGAALAETEFVYQGRLDNGAAPFNGSIEMTFRLWDAESGGTQIGGDRTQTVDVVDGLFQVELDFGTVFTGGFRFLEIEIDGTLLTPRQAVTPAPMAYLAVDTLPGLFWRQGGNAGTDPVSDFLGTTDNQPLVLRTANVRSLRIEPSSEIFGTPALPITANVIAGSHANEVSVGVRGATIAGGGVPPGDSDPVFGSENPNIVTDHYGAIGGGYGNQAGDGDGSPEGDAFITVGGGLSNTASGGSSTIGGGVLNAASGDRSTVGGGNRNTASGSSSTVGGGSSNIAEGLFGTVGGGGGNTGSGASSTVGGGNSNTASGSNSTVGGGVANCAGGSNSWAGGLRAKVRPGSASGDPGSGCDGVPESGDSDGHEGTFVWADSQSADFISSGPDQFLIRAGGNVGINTNAPEQPLDVAGDVLFGGGASGFDADAEVVQIRAQSLAWNVGVENASNSADSHFFVSSGSGSNDQTFSIGQDGSTGFGRAPEDHFEIQTPFDETSDDGTSGSGAFRVRLNGSTRLRLLRNGGLAVGSSYNSSGVPARGMRVAGAVELASLGSGGSTDLCRNGDGAISTCSSSARYKHDIVDLEGAASLIEQLRPVRYRWRETDVEDIGLVAEEVAEVEPSLVTYNDDGHIEGVRYRQLGAVLVRAFQEQRRDNDRLREQVSALQREVDQTRELTHRNVELADRVTRLEALLLDQWPMALEDPPSAHSAESGRATRQASSKR